MSLENIDIDSLQEALNNLSEDIVKIEEDLDRYLEIFRLFQTEQKLDEIQNRMEKLIDQQNALNNDISKENNETTLMIEKYLLGLSLIILLFGVNSYYGHKKKEYGSKFNFHRFLFGNIKCSRITSITGI